VFLTAATSASCLQESAVDDVSCIFDRDY